MFVLRCNIRKRVKRKKSLTIVDNVRFRKYRNNDDLEDLEVFVGYNELRYLCNYLLPIYL